MKPREFLSRANRVQQTSAFKVVATIVVLAIAIAGFIVYTVRATAPLGPEGGTPAAAAAAGSDAGAERSALDTTERILRDVMTSRADPTNVGVGVAVVAAVAVTVIWLGLGLTYLALVAVALGVALPLSHPAIGMPGAARLIVGIVALTASFTALMQALRVLLSGPGPVFAIARNVLAEATRMNVSVVFIVLLVFGLAALPGTLDATQPLRYRVQAFLQYGTGGAFWLIALLTVVFAAASVAFEQRDRQIWQTMTKPVASWQYVLGKWLGVAGLAAVLLAVCGASIFLFTEYLRRQPAQGEERLVAMGSAAPTASLSEDRWVLETQVLVARRSVGPTLPLTPADPEFQEAVQGYLENARRTDAEFATDPASLNKVKSDLFQSWMQSYRTIEPMLQEIYVFEGLDRARQAGIPLTLRYRFDSGDNAPNKVYKITFILGGRIGSVQEAGLGSTHTLSLSPSVIDDLGRVELVVVNGDLERQIPNEMSISFPADGLELSYAVGSYRMNFLRVVFVLWVKLAFLAMLGVAAATFLSFPVACFVALCTFMAAEGTGYLSNALDVWSTTKQGKLQVFNVIIAIVARTVVWMFDTYAQLKPTQKLVDGRLLSWGSVSWGAGVLGIWSAVLYGGAVLIFRRRELATYSGQ